MQIKSSDDEKIFFDVCEMQLFGRADDVPSVEHKLKEADVEAIASSWRVRFDARACFCCCVLSPSMRLIRRVAL